MYNDSGDDESQPFTPIKGKSRMLPSPAVTDKKSAGLSLNIPGAISPEMPLKKLENMMLNQLIPLESPTGIVIFTFSNSKRIKIQIHQRN